MTSENQYYREMEGDLIQLAKEGRFDVIAHGCNCFNTMKKGIALAMAENFHCREFELESGAFWKGNINKLGQIDYRKYTVLHGIRLDKPLVVVNCYTQYSYQKHPIIPDPKPIDYEAFRLCMRKLNHKFKGLHIGLPRIGSGLAGGVWDKESLTIQGEAEFTAMGNIDLKTIIQQELKDCNVTIVIHKN